VLGIRCALSFFNSIGDTLTSCLAMYAEQERTIWKICVGSNILLRREGEAIKNRPMVYNVQAANVGLIFG
jgi:hypothetical protein